jgi:hypothetical protein
VWGLFDGAEDNSDDGGCPKGGAVCVGWVWGDSQGWLGDGGELRNCGLEDGGSGVGECCIGKGQGGWRVWMGGAGGGG